ncbi:hypothetical protein IW140_001776 [Coemansia sp. RSA 1813]|nr:hypothetical protein EV178_002593 [Coemansia sp. RSA 1646]KAJ1769670.1 hypothetical protein LPJ74_003822 [Coemansia sp. RSA 1843]KAJ2091201.1 hypothetical protein IW138_002164 [Coemansia sp. RSA 986]KAJ2211635.1 hypothetical protein EV179_005307 [Coemansia sp. RSA 487]KAJ2571074.1 hypothetical protein IW140_001776 [Coemansia sp. RSA 1813]
MASAGNSNQSRNLRNIDATDASRNSPNVSTHIHQSAVNSSQCSSNAMDSRSSLSLGSAPAAMAFKYDRRRDFYTDPTTLTAATGSTAPKNAGVSYDRHKGTRAEAVDISTSKTGRRYTPSTTIVHSGGEAVPSGGSGRQAKRSSKSSKRAGTRKGLGGSFPLFRRANNSKLEGISGYGEYGSDSHLPRFMVDKLRRVQSTDRAASTSTDGAACSSGRASVASSDSVLYSPISAGSSSAMQNILELEEAKLLEAERKSQLRAVDSILSDEQKIAYVGLVYLLLVDIQERLNVQFKESQSSTASFMNFSRRLMRNMYAHIRLSPEEQRMVEVLPRHKITAADMAQSLAAQGDTVYVEADQDLAVMHAMSDEELIKALRGSCEGRSSNESARRGSHLGWLGRKMTPAAEDTDVYSQYSMLPVQSTEPEPGHTSEDEHRSTPSSKSSSAHSSRRSSLSLERARLDLPDDKEASDNEAESHEPNESRTRSNTRSLDHETYMAPKSIEPATANEPDELTLTAVNAEQPLAIDVRATLVLDMFLLLLSDEVYDSRGRYLLRRLSRALKYPWVETMKCERRVTQQLSLHDYAVNVTSATKNTTTSAVKERSEKNMKKRLVIIGLATVGGGLVIGLSAGLLAPAIGAGIGATLGAIGVANTGAFFGSIGGTALITGAATLTGSGMAGRQMTRRTRFAEQIEFIPCIDEKQTNLILTVPGWLGKADNGVFSFSTLHPINGDHFSLFWEAEALRQLGSSLRMIVGEVFSITLTQTLQHTVLPSLLGPLSIPMWLAKLGYVLDNPWSNACELASSAGPVIADLLLQRVQGQRPVTLVGYSVGARLIFYALLELASMSAYGLIEDVYLFGAPVVASEEEWRTAASVVGGRFVNAYSTKDWILGFFYRTTSLGRRSVAGLHPISGVNGLENLDVSEDVPGHNAYREVIPKLLQRLGTPVTSTDLYDPNEVSGDSENDRVMISELEKAAEMLEEHEKKKKNLWPWRWSFWETGTNVPSETSNRDRAKSESAALAAVSSEVDEAARELAALGIGIKEVPSTMPALVVESNGKNQHARAPHDKEQTSNDHQQQT